MGRKSKPIFYINGMSVRTCGRCGEQKPSGMFYNSGFSASGLDYYCKMCRNITRRPSKNKLAHRKRKNIKASNKKCDECGADCDGTLKMGAVIRCSACFDKIVYGENPTQWSLPQRSPMLL